MGPPSGRLPSTFEWNEAARFRARSRQADAIKHRRRALASLGVDEGRRL
ncbi:hypothetical protein ACEN88_22800 [Massilia sp. CT11-108]